MLTDRQMLVELLVEHEGLRLFPYTDTVGKTTIGVGRNLTDVGLSHAEAYLLLDHDIEAATADLASFPWFIGVDPVRQRALIDLRFNLGPDRFRGFQKMLVAMARHDYTTAAAEMLNSKWATQVGARAVTLARMMRQGT